MSGLGSALLRRTCTLMNEIKFFFIIFLITCKKVLLVNFDNYQFRKYSRYRISLNDIFEIVAFILKTSFS